LRKPRATSATREIWSIRRSLAAIGQSLQRLTPFLHALGENVGGTRPRTRKLRLSPERRAVLRLQGQYMGYLRGLRPRQKSQVKALRGKKGFRAAISLAKRLARATRD